MPIISLLSCYQPQDSEQFVNRLSNQMEIFDPKYHGNIIQAILAMWRNSVSPEDRLEKSKTLSRLFFTKSLVQQSLVSKTFLDKSGRNSLLNYLQRECPKLFFRYFEGFIAEELGLNLTIFYCEVNKKMGNLPIAKYIKPNVIYKRLEKLLQKTQSKNTSRLMSLVNLLKFFPDIDTQFLNFVYQTGKKHFEKNVYDETMRAFFKALPITDYQFSLALKLSFIAHSFDLNSYDYIQKLRHKLLEIKNNLDNIHSFFDFIFPENLDEVIPWILRLMEPENRWELQRVGLSILMNLPQFIQDDPAIINRMKDFISNNEYQKSPVTDLFLYFINGHLGFFSEADAKKLVIILNKEIHSIELTYIKFIIKFIKNLSKNFKTIHGDMLKFIGYCLEDSAITLSKTMFSFSKETFDVYNVLNGLVPSKEAQFEFLPNLEERLKGHAECFCPNLELYGVATSFLILNPNLTDDLPLKLINFLTNYSINKFPYLSLQLFVHYRSRMDSAQQKQLLFLMLNCLSSQQHDVHTDLSLFFKLLNKQNITDLLDDLVDDCLSHFKSNEDILNHQISSNVAYYILLYALVYQQHLNFLRLKVLTSIYEELHPILKDPMYKIGEFLGVDFLSKDQLAAFSEKMNLPKLKNCLGKFTIFQSININNKRKLGKPMDLDNQGYPIYKKRNT